ncbi:molybdopterin-dependent oxidoreductase [Thermodesulfobacteriota bacterium]
MSTGNDVKVIPTACLHDCGGRCPLKAHVKDGVIIRIENDTRLRACLRGHSLRQRVYHPDRLKFPMKRTGERGKGEFDRISWDEALDTVAGELLRVKEEYGNEAIYFSGSGSSAVFHNRRGGYRLLNMFGGCTTPRGNVSNESSIYASISTYGTMWTGNTRDDLVHSRLIIMWGWNPVETIWDTGTSFWLAQAREAGARIVCVDPRHSDSAAAFASQWIPIYPGTDAAMLIAMAFVIIEEGLQDQTFLDTYTIGFDRYRDYVTGAQDGVQKTPAWAERITGVSAAVIERLAREYAQTKPAALLATWAPGRSSYGEQYHRAAIALAAMTGNVGIHGGNAAGWEWAYPSTPSMGGLPVGKNPMMQGTAAHKNSLPHPAAPNPSTARIHNTQVWEAILEGKKGGYPADIKLGYFMGGNPITQLADTNQGVKALKSLEFVVVHEQFMTSTAKFADILLPVNTTLEKEDIGSPWLGAPYYVYANKVIDSLHESKSDLEICSMLAPRLGIENYNDKTDEEWLRQIVEASTDIPDYEEFKRTGIHIIELEEPWVSFKDQIEDPENHPFPTPSGKIEIYSQMLADLDNPEIPPIPTYVPVWEGRDDPLAEKYPLQLITSHFKRRVHSIFDNVPWLEDMEPQAVTISSEDAAARGIAGGDHVRVFNHRGEMVIEVVVSERIMPGVVHIHEGGFFDPDERGVDRGGCPNIFLGPRPSPGGAFCTNTALVQIEKA